MKITESNCNILERIIPRYSKAIWFCGYAIAKPFRNEIFKLILEKKEIFNKLKKGNRVTTCYLSGYMHKHQSTHEISNINESTILTLNYSDSFVFTITLIYKYIQVAMSISTTLTSNSYPSKYV